MALIVEDGTGLANANSYADVEFADLYFLGHLYYSELWDEYSNFQKERALQWASSFLDQVYDWNGEKTVEASALRWPRCGVLTLDGTEIADNSVPLALKKATCELAVEMLQGDKLAAADSSGIKELKVDVIELKFDNSEAKPVITGRVNTLLRGLGTTALGSRMVKVYRS